MLRVLKRASEAGECRRLSETSWGTENAERLMLVLYEFFQFALEPHDPKFPVERIGHGVAHRNAHKLPPGRKPSYECAPFQTCAALQAAGLLSWDRLLGDKISMLHEPLSCHAVHRHLANSRLLILVELLKGD